MFIAAQPFVDEAQPRAVPDALDRSRATRAFGTLNFFMADMQAGIGPFLGVFLRQRGRLPGAIGSVTTAGGVAGMLMTVRAGAFIDPTNRKRLAVVVTGICTVLASFLILWSQSGLVVTVSQVATAITGAAIGQAVAGMTLGIVRQQGFNAQNGLNQAWNHAGNLIGFALGSVALWAGDGAPMRPACVGAREPRLSGFRLEGKPS